jgi:hypothetical protein
MEFLGISTDDSTIYEGHMHAGFRPVTQPLLVPIEFLAFPLTAWSKSAPSAPSLFREDFFDPITRIRRGRVFALRDCSQPSVWQVHDPLRPHPHTSKIHYQERVYLYERSGLGPLRIAPLKTANHDVVIGAEPFISFWKIISVENSVHGTPILTLKSYRSLGDLPELITSRVPEEIRAKLNEVLEHVANSNNRAGALDVVDRSRAALSLILGHLAGDRGLDLGATINKIQAEKQNSRPLLCHAASIVARLHSRGKPNEEFNHGTRPVSEEDAQLAIGCLGLVLKEIGWAKL